MTACYKDIFVQDTGIYMLSHSVGRPPVTTRAAWEDGFLDPWENAGEAVWPRWLESVDGFRNALADLLRGDAACFCPQVNLSSALTKILFSMPLKEQRKTIVYTERDFPSMAFVLAQAERAGYRLHAVPAEVDMLDVDAWEPYLSADVAFLLLTHVHSNTGQQVPVAELSALARSRKIVSIVDIAQSVGCVPIDLGSWQADFVIGSCVKWLCGGPGAGFLWVDPVRMQECEPLDVGWFSHEDPFEFDPADFRYAADALRFWGGTPSVQPYVTAANSIRVLLDIGIGAIRAHNLELTQVLVEAIDRAHLVTPADPALRGGTVVIKYPGKPQQSLIHKLREAGVLFDARETGIRLSPHIYNDAAEIAAVQGCLPA